MRILPLALLSTALPLLGATHALADGPFDGRGGFRHGAGRGSAPDHGGPHGARLRMPDVTGMPVSEARSALEALGLPVSVEERLVPEAVLDVVLAQEPTAGGPLFGPRLVVLSIARTVRVPNLVGEGLEHARRLTRRLGISLHVEAPFRHDVRPLPFREDDRLLVATQNRLVGTRIAQGSRLVVHVRPRPTPQHAPWGSAQPQGGGFAPPHRPHVAPTVAADLVLVPNLVGRTVDEARALLTQIGLTAQLVGLDGNTRPSGRPGARPTDEVYVAAQGVAPGLSVARGAAVVLTLARRGR